jgi:hypothetical protein
LYKRLVTNLGEVSAYVLFTLEQLASSIALAVDYASPRSEYLACHLTRLIQATEDVQTIELLEKFDSAIEAVHALVYYIVEL